LTDEIFTLRKTAQGFRDFGLCTATRLLSSEPELQARKPDDHAVTPPTD